MTVKNIYQSFTPQDGCESQLASKLRHCHPIDIELGLICVYVAKGWLVGVEFNAPLDTV